MKTIIFFITTFFFLSYNNDISISGQSTHFTQATSVYNVWFNQGSTTVYPNYTNATSETVLSAQFSFSNNLPLGYYDANVYTPSDGLVTKYSGFLLNPNPNPPEIITVNPSSGYRGQTLNVSFSGQNTHFTQATSVYNVWFNQGSTTIYPNYTNATSETTLSTQFSFSNNLPLGYYDANVYTPSDGVVTKYSGFLLNPNPNPPEIITVNPSTGYRNQSLSVSISGQNTHFDQVLYGYNVWFSQGSTTIYPQNISPSSTTLINTNFYFNSYYPLGYYDVNVFNNIDGVVTKTAGFLLEDCPAPATPSYSGTICQGASVTLTIPPVPDATSYYWYISPSYAGNISGGTSASLILDPSFTGNVEVYVIANNSCGGSVSWPAEIVVHPLPGIPLNITGTTEFCMGQTTAVYSVSAISNADSYSWQITPGSAGTIAANGISANVTWNSSFIGNATISVHGVNSCGSGLDVALFVSINSQLPGSAGTITGATTVCQGENNVMYTVPAISDAASYIWTIPDGSTLITLSNSIIIDYSFSAATGLLSVYGNNGCGTGTSSSVVITVETAPDAPIISLINDTLFSDVPYGNQWYYFGSPIAGATNSFYPVISHGEYYAIVNAGNCNSDTSNIIYITVGINESEINKGILIFPNPVTGESFVTVKGENLLNCKTIIYNSLGQIVKIINNTSSNDAIIIRKENLKPGIYFIEISGSKKYQARFIVE